MENQQNPTETDTPHIYEALDENDYLYVDMRVQGFLCSHIALAAKRQHGTVREWFAKGGRLHEAYQYRLQEHRKEYHKAFKDIDRLIKDGAVYAVLKELEAVKASGTWPAQILAAKDLLSRAGFDPIEGMDAHLTRKTDTAVVEAARKLLEENDESTIR